MWFKPLNITVLNAHYGATTPGSICVLRIPRGSGSTNASCRVSRHTAALVFCQLMSTVQQRARSVGGMQYRPLTDLRILNAHPATREFLSSVFQQATGHDSLRPRSEFALGDVQSRVARFVSSPVALMFARVLMSWFHRETAPACVVRNSG